MQIATCLHAGVAATWIAVAVGVAAAPAAAASAIQSPPAMTEEGLPAAAPVPPGGLITSFLNNQLRYCSIICPLLVQTAVTAAVTTQEAPGTFGAALQQSGDPTKAIGVTATSITGPTNAAAQKSIVADGTEVAPRALNAFEVGVVGLLNVGSAAAGGLPAIAAAVQTARQDTYTALNRPIVPNPRPTVMPHGVTQVATIAAINVGAAVIFPAFNDVLSGTFQTVDATAQELAATGDPARAFTAGVNTATAAQTAARTVVEDSIAGAADKIRTASADEKLHVPVVPAQEPKNVQHKQPGTEPPRHL